MTLKKYIDHEGHEVHEENQVMGTRRLNLKSFVLFVYFVVPPYSFVIATEILCQRVAKK
jgi:hypothetical protein